MTPRPPSSRGTPYPRGFSPAKPYLARDITDTRPYNAAQCAKLSLDSFFSGSSVPSFPHGNHFEEGCPNPCIPLASDCPTDITRRLSPTELPICSTMHRDYTRSAEFGGRDTPIPHWKGQQLQSNHETFLTFWMYDVWLKPRLQWNSATYRASTVDLIL